MFVFVSIPNTHLVSFVATITKSAWHPLQNTKDSGCEQEVHLQYTACTFDHFIKSVINNLAYLFSFWANWTRWTLEIKAKVDITNSSS